MSESIQWDKKGALPMEPAERTYTCCFTGHRTLSVAERARLTLQLHRAVGRMIVRKGVQRFVCGGARGFDLLAARTVLQMRRIHPQVRLVMALPCPDQTRRWDAADVRLYKAVLEAADEVHTLAPAYTDDCMLARNRFMVEQSAFCIAYCKRWQGGTAYTVRYAHKQGVRVYNLAHRPIMHG